MPGSQPIEVFGASRSGDDQLDLLDTAAAGPAAIRGSLIRTAGYLGTAAVSLISISLLIRHIGVEEFGHYVTVVSLVALAATLSDAGLTTIGIREYAARPAVSREVLMANLLGLRCVLTAVGVGGAVLFAAIAGYGARLIEGTLIAGAGIVLVVLQGTYAVPLTAGLQLGKLTALDFGRQVLITALTVAAVLAGGTLLVFLALPIPIGALIVVVTMRMVRGSMPLRPRLDLGECRELMRAIVPIALAVAIAAIYFRVSLILMSLIATSAQTGYFATAYRVLEVIIQLPGLIVGAAFPILARAARDDAARLEYGIQRLAEAMIIVGAFVGMSVILGAAFAVEVLAGGTAGPAVGVLQLQGIAIAVSFLTTAWSFGLLSIARYRSLLTITATGVTTVFVLTLVLEPIFDAQGTALAIVAADTIQSVLAFLVLRRHVTGIRFPFGLCLRVAAATGLGFTTLLVPGLTAFTRTVIGAVVYSAALIALGAIPEELAHAFRERFGRDRAV